MKKYIVTNDKFSKNIIKYWLYITLLLWVISSLSVLFITLLESFTYRGFFLKHYVISFRFPISISVFFVFCQLFILLKYEIVPIYKKLIFIVSKISLILFATTLSSYLFFNFIESKNYPNFVFSKIHLQPKLLNGPLNVAFIVFSINIFFIHLLFSKNKKENTFHFHKGIKKFSNRLYKYIFNRIFYQTIDRKKITNIRKHINSHFKGNKYMIGFLAGIQRLYKSILKFINGDLKFKPLLYFMYSLLILYFTANNFLIFVPNFYKVDKAYRQENELKYAFGEMDIHAWIAEYLPKTRAVIEWCNIQEKPVNLVTFDPEMIWLNYEALSRVFLTNCNYVNIYSVKESLPYYLEMRDLLFVSISECNPSMVYKELSINDDIYEYFRQLNNKYVCKSGKIVRGLYHYKDVR